MLRQGSVSLLASPCAHTCTHAHTHPQREGRQRWEAHKIPTSPLESQQLVKEFSALGSLQRKNVLEAVGPTAGREGAAALCCLAEGDTSSGVGLPPFLIRQQEGSWLWIAGVWGGVRPPHLHSQVPSAALGHRRGTQPPMLNSQTAPCGGSRPEPAQKGPGQPLQPQTFPSYGEQEGGQLTTGIQPLGSPSLARQGGKMLLPASKDALSVWGQRPSAGRREGAKGLLLRWGRPFQRWGSRGPSEKNGA